MEREIMIVTPGKLYAGMLEFENPNLRTIDYVINPKRNVGIRQGDQGSILLDGFLNVKKVAVYSLGQNGYFEDGLYESLNIRKSNIIFFFDKFDKLGSSSERNRVEMFNSSTMTSKKIEITTRTVGKGYFRIKGEYRGLPTNLVNSEFVALINAEFEEVRDKQLITRQENPFIALNPNFIEGYYF